MSSVCRGMHCLSLGTIPPGNLCTGLSCSPEAGPARHGCVGSATRRRWVRREQTERVCLSTAVQTASSNWNFTLNCKEATSRTGALAFLVYHEFCSQFWTLQTSAFLVTCLWWRLICKLQGDRWSGWETPAKPWNQHRLREGHQNSQVIKKSMSYQAIRF